MSRGKTRERTIAVKPHEGRLVEIHRKTIDEEPLAAYVLATSARLVLLQPIRDRIDLDGYDVVRVADISEITESPKATFYEEALALKRMRRKKPRGVALDDMGALLASLQSGNRLVVISRELRFPNECEIGRIRSLAKTTYQLDWITPTADWENDDRVFELADITRVQFDGAYENTLADVAAARAKSRR